MSHIGKTVSRNTPLSKVLYLNAKSYHDLTRINEAAIDTNNKIFCLIAIERELALMVLKKSNNANMTRILSPTKALNFSSTARVPARTDRMK
jgi:hypothetical protein